MSWESSELRQFELEVDIRALAAEGKLKDAEAAFRERAPLVPPPGAVAAGGATIEGWEQAGEYAHAYAILKELRVAIADALASPMPLEVHVAFHNTAGNALRGVGRIE